jgi:hypothetical protein
MMMTLGFLAGASAASNVVSGATNREVARAMTACRIVLLMVEDCLSHLR